MENGVHSRLDRIGGETERLNAPEKCGEEVVKRERREFGLEG